MNINYFGTLNVCNALFPLLRNNARVVNLSSRLGLLNQVSNKDIKKKICSESLTVEEISEIVNEYIEYGVILKVTAIMALPKTRKRKAEILQSYKID